MNLYEHMSQALALAEKIGEVRTVELRQKSKWADHCIEISGISKDGEAFSVSVRIEGREE